MCALGRCWYGLRSRSRLKQHMLKLSMLTYIPPKYAIIDILLSSAWYIGLLRTSAQAAG